MSKIKEINLSLRHGRKVDTVPTKDLFRSMKLSTNPVTRGELRRLIISRFESGNY